MSLPVWHQGQGQDGYQVSLSRSVSVSIGVSLSMTERTVALAPVAVLTPALP